MPAFPRAEMEEMVRRWLEANEDAEAAGDWKPMAEFYTKDAEYTWNLGPNEDFVAKGRDQIRDWCLGSEMEGLEGWEYPYDKVLIDEKQGEVVAFWRQVAPGNPGIMIREGGGQLSVSTVAAQALPRYRLSFNVEIFNLTNRSNFVGYSGVMTSPLFLKPTNVSGVRRINIGMSLSF